MRKKSSARFESDQLAPRRVGGRGRRDGAVDLLDGRERDLARLLARRRVVDGSLAPGIAPDALPADPVPDRLQLCGHRCVHARLPRCRLLVVVAYRGVTSYGPAAATQE